MSEGNNFESVYFIDGENMPIELCLPVDKPFTVAGHTFKSRLIIGTGKYKSYADNAAALEASGAVIVTVAVRRVNLTRFHRSEEIHLPAKHRRLLHRRGRGAYTAPGEAGGWTLVKLEVLGDKKTLYPNMAAI